MIRCGDGDDINVFILQKFPDVGIALHIFKPRFLADSTLVPKNMFIDITKRDEAHAFYIAQTRDVVASASVKANDRDTNIAVRAEDAFVYRECECASGQRRFLKEATTS